MESIRGWLEKYLLANNEFSDIFLRIGLRPLVKTEGMQLQSIDNAPFVTEEDIAWVAHQKRLNWDGIVDIDDGSTISDTRFRVNIFRSSGGGGAVLRKLASDPPELETLGLPVDIITQYINASSGLIFETGETGSGKSTSMAAMMKKRAEMRSTTTVTIEDPIELLFPQYIQSNDGGLSQFIQRQVGIDTASFASGLRAALREAPNVITVGEIRDSETARLAFQAAETGHLVMATLHTKSAVETVTRLLNFFQPEEHDMVRNQLASILQMVIRQSLLPTIDNQKRVLAYEIMVQTSSVSSVIRSKTFNTAQLQNELRSGKEHGMMTLNESLAMLVREGVVDRDIAIRTSYDPNDLREKI